MSEQERILLTKLELALKTVSRSQNNWKLFPGNLLDLKKQLLNIINNNDFDTRALFFILWSESNKQLRIIACYLIPKFINHANEESIAVLNKILSGLDSSRLTEVLSQNFAAAIYPNYFDWLVYLGKWSSHKNIWIRCFVVQTLGYMGDFKTIGIPYYLLILKKMMTASGELIQKCLSWSLLHLYDRWPESVRSFIESYKSSTDKNSILIICKLAMGTGLWIIPLLEHWLQLEDVQIRENVKSTLLLLSKNIIHE